MNGLMCGLPFARLAYMLLFTTGRAWHAHGVSKLVPVSWVPAQGILESTHPSTNESINEGIDK